MRMRCLDIIRILFIGFIGLFVFIFAVLIRNTCLPHIANTLNPQNYKIQYEEVNFTTEDNIRLSGWLMMKDKENPTIIVCHGLGANRSDVLEFGYILYKSGYNIFMFDFRGHAESQGWYTSFGYLEQKDLIAAIQYLNNKGIKDMGIFGISMSGAIAILVASENPDIKAVVADSPYIDLDETIINHTRFILNIPGRLLGKLSILAYRLRFFTDSSKVSPVRSIHKVSPRAVFIINGADDDRMKADDAKKLFDSASLPKELWLVEGAGHLESYSKATLEYQRRIIDFFRTHLPLRRG